MADKIEFYLTRKQFQEVLFAMAIIDTMTRVCNFLETFPSPDDVFIAVRKMVEVLQEASEITREIEK